MSKYPKKYMSWDDIDRHAFYIVKQMKEDGFKPDMIIGLARGGLPPAVLLSNHLSIPLLTVDISFRDGMVASSPWPAIKKKLTYLVLDDINDSGKTFDYINTYLTTRNITFKTAAIISKKSSKFTVDYEGQMQYNDSWIVYPWERVNYE